MMSQGRDIDLRPASAGVAGVFHMTASGGGGLDNIRCQGRAGGAEVGGGNAAVVLIGEIHHEIDGVLVRDGIDRVRRGPCGRVVVLGGGKRLGGQQGPRSCRRPAASP